MTKTALQLRADITKQDVSQAWPPETDKSYNIPNSVLQFLHTLLSGGPATVNQSEREERLSNSFGNMVCALANGKRKPPKHILLPSAVKSLTENIELLHTLNRFGHSVSYSQLEETDTKFAFRNSDKLRVMFYYLLISTVVISPP